MKSTKKILKKDMKKMRELVNIHIDRHLPKKDEYPKIIHKAMRYSLFAGGKGVRSYLAIATYKLFSDDIDLMIPLAAAMEIIHTYTLIHDDLPYLDDDDFRRGKKSCHNMFGQDIALLAGDALLIYAMEIIATMEIDNGQRATITKLFTQHIGATGLIGGQFMDIESENNQVSVSTLRYIHSHKTGKFFNLAIKLTNILGKPNEEEAKNLINYSDTIGLLFQVVDDILDIESNLKSLGKTVGKDIMANKATYPSVFGLDISKQEANRLLEKAKGYLNIFEKKAEMLLHFTDFIATREY